MNQQAGVDAGAAAYRGFLFSDVRGFTAYAERQGNVAAAAMVGRFLELARREIAKHDGAEIKTEGDAIHAVFPSASGAVMCGLDIVDAAAELNEREPGQPLNLGVGVHAGEAVETAEGYIGSAVNLAARLCAAARPGEVLVTDTVRGITQASIPVGFIAKGRLRLKGIRDPVQAYAVTRDLTAPAARVLPRLGMALTVGGVAGIALIGVLVVGLSLPPGGLASKPSPFPGPTAAVRQPVVIGALPIATYVSTGFQPPVSFRIGDLGWAASRDQQTMLALVREDSPKGSVFFLRVRQVSESPCGPGEPSTAAPTAPELVTQLEALPPEFLTIDNRMPTQLGGLPGEMLDVHVADGALAACGGLVGGGVSIFETGGEVWSAASGEWFRLISVGRGDLAVTVIVSADWTTTPSVQEVQNIFDLGGRILNTVDLRGT